MDFKIYYGDESVFVGNIDQIKKNAPRLNVQAIAWADPDKSAYGVGRCVLHTADYYLYTYEQERFIKIVGETDLVDHILHGGETIVFKGRTIRDEIYRSIVKRATEDLGLPPKSAVNKRLEGNR